MDTLDALQTCTPSRRRVRKYLYGILTPLDDERQGPLSVPQEQQARQDAHIRV
jgi:hypothetical protein